MKKRAATLIILLSLLLCACGSTKTPAPTQTPPAAAAEPTAEPTVEPTTEPTPEPTESPAPADTPEPTAEPTPDATPVPMPDVTPTPEPAASVEEPTPTETPEALLYSVKTTDTVLTVKGTAAGREWYFTLAELQSLGGYVAADYFSRGKEPQEMTTSFEGISVQYLFESVMGLADYKKATFRATDGYSVSFSKSAVGMTYMNEQDESAQLKMILAWRQDGEDITLRLAMGQMAAGEYNRTNWARGVCEIEVKS